MSQTVEFLLKNSGLPGPRGNLSLLYDFAKTATGAEIDECLALNAPDLNNSPEEFAVMCGVVGFSVQNKNDLPKMIQTIRRYASHNSWRIREGVAIGIQEVAENRLNLIMDLLEEWIDGNDLEKRAIVAALCEPKLLKKPDEIIRVFKILNQVTSGFAKMDSKLTNGQNSLRQTLGYGWSVAMVALPEEGKAAFEKLITNANKHIHWIIKENLKKHRLSVMDSVWVQKCVDGLLDRFKRRVFSD